jgi:hypothetical protein
MIFDVLDGPLQYVESHTGIGRYYRSLLEVVANTIGVAGTISRVARIAILQIPIPTNLKGQRRSIFTLLHLNRRTLSVSTLVLNIASQP